jgi:hypothetical protein
MKRNPPCLAEHLVCERNQIDFPTSYSMYPRSRHKIGDIAKVSTDEGGRCFVYGSLPVHIGQTDNLHHCHVPCSYCFSPRGVYLF